MWLACYTQEEIAEAVKMERRTGKQYGDLYINIRNNS